MGFLSSSNVTAFHGGSALISRKVLVHFQEHMHQKEDNMIQKCKENNGTERSLYISLDSVRKTNVY